MHKILNETLKHEPQSLGKHSNFQQAPIADLFTHKHTAKRNIRWHTRSHTPGMNLHLNSPATTTTGTSRVAITAILSYNHHHHHYHARCSTLLRYNPRRPFTMDHLLCNYSYISGKITGMLHTGLHILDNLHLKASTQLNMSLRLNTFRRFVFLGEKGEKNSCTKFCICLLEVCSTWQQPGARCLWRNSETPGRFSVHIRATIHASL